MDYNSRKFCNAICDPDCRCDDVSGKLFARRGRLSTRLLRLDVEFVEVVKRQAQEVMLVSPGHLAFGEALTFSRRWRRVSDLGDKVCRRCLCDTVHQNTDVRNAQGNCEGEGKAKEYTFAIPEPSALLLGRKSNTREIWLELKDIRTAFAAAEESHLQVHASDCGKRSRCVGMSRYSTSGE